jgi:hypothetical protein
VQAGLVLWAVEVRPPKLKDSSVVPPQEEADSSLNQVCYNHESPELRAKDVLWGQLQQSRHRVPLLVERRSSHDIDWYQDTTTNDRNHTEYIAEHANESHEDDSI